MQVTLLDHVGRWDLQSDLKVWGGRTSRLKGGLKTHTHTHTHTHKNTHTYTYTHTHTHTHTDIDTHTDTQMRAHRLCTTHRRHIDTLFHALTPYRRMYTHLRTDNALSTPTYIAHMLTHMLTLVQNLDINRSLLTFDVASNRKWNVSCWELCLYSKCKTVKVTNLSSATFWLSALDTCLTSWTRVCISAQIRWRGSTSLNTLGSAVVKLESASQHRFGGVEARWVLQWWKSLS